MTQVTKTCICKSPPVPDLGPKWSPLCAGRGEPPSSAWLFPGCVPLQPSRRAQGLGRAVGAHPSCTGAVWDSHLQQPATLFNTLPLAHGSSAMNQSCCRSSCSRPEILAVCVPQVFYVASFLYTVNYTWHLYRDLKMKYNQNLNRMPPTVVDYASYIGRVATILSSLLPFLLMVPVFCLGNNSNCYQNFSQKHGCLLMHTDVAVPTSEPLTLNGSVCRVMHFYGVGVFLVSFLISFVAILVVLVQARGLYKRFVNSTGFLGDQQWAMIKMVEQRVVFYPIAFFCCWAPAVLLGILKLAVSTSSKIYMALLILQALTAASQGLLNCIVYGWTQHVFLSLKRNACRDVDTQTPLLRSQKKFYDSTLPASPPDAEVSTSTLL
uniref:Transmembrane protein 116 n=1 Tax=Anser cygnoides TaxID=8845 RepID=A0A8B9DTF7_ANSCY